MQADILKPDPTRWLDDMTDEQLIGCKAASELDLKTALETDGKVEQELQRRAAERGAKVIHGQGMDYEIKTPKEYDRTQLPPLVELLTPIQKGKCYAKGHEEKVWVEEKYDMAHWNKAGRENGGELQEGLDALTFPGKTTGKLVASPSSS